MIRWLGGHAEHLDAEWSFEPVPSALRNDDKIARPETIRLLVSLGPHEERRFAIHHHHDLIADGVAFPLARPGPVPHRDSAVAVPADLAERSSRLLGGGGW